MLALPAPVLHAPVPHVLVLPALYCQVPVVVLSDHAVSPDVAAAQTQESYWGINITHVEAALAHLLAEGQEGVVITTWHELHKHKQLAAALHKATRSHSEAVVDIPSARDYKGTDMGIHVNTHTFIDPDVLLKEIEMSADMLTHGLVSECLLGSADMMPADRLLLCLQQAMHACAFIVITAAAMSAGRQGRVRMF